MSARGASPLPLLAAAAAAGASAAFLLPLLARALPRLWAPPAPPAPPVFVLAVRIRLRPRALYRFIELWSPLAAHVRAGEPRTLSYELCLGEGAAEADRGAGAEVLIYERYADKAALTGPHHSSPAFAAFQAALAAQDLTAERSRATYYESGVGFMAR